MEKTITLFLIVLFNQNTIGQTCQQDEIKIRYTNGFEIFNICKSNPQITFEESREYYWYTEFSKIKSTKGGCGGQLLHGNYKFYDEDGNLMIDQNYVFGLEHGDGKKWDNEGNIVQITKHDRGEYIYWKFKEDVNVCDPNGSLLEIPIFTKMVPFS